MSVKKRHVCEKDYIWNPATRSCENGKYLASIMDDSVITCDEIIEETTFPTNFNEKKQTVKPKISMFTHIYIKYYSIINICQCLLLFDKIQNKMKTFTTISHHK